MMNLSTNEAANAVTTPLWLPEAEAGAPPCVVLAGGMRYGPLLRDRDLGAQVRFLEGELDFLGQGDHLVIGTGFGSDVAMALAWHRLAKQGQAPKLHVVAPFLDYSATWPQDWREPFERATEGAEWHFAADRHSPGVYTRRDQHALRLADDLADSLGAERLALTFWAGERGALSESLLDMVAHGFELRNLYHDYRAFLTAPVGGA